MRRDGWQAVPTLGGILHPPPLLLGAFHLGPDNVKGGILLWTQTDICLLLSDTFLATIHNILLEMVILLDACIGVPYPLSA